jgi:Zn-dependent metalloprotease
MAVMAFCGTQLGYAASPQANPGAVSDVLRSLRSADSAASPLVYRNDAGFLRFVGAPAGGYFAVPGGAKSGDPEGAAERFADYHGAAFGNVSPSAFLETMRTLSLDERTAVHFEQRYDHMPVFGASMVVQVDAAGQVLSAAGDLTSRLDAFDEGVVNPQPALTAEAAADAAKARVAQRNPGAAISTLTVVQRPSLTVYDPEVQGSEGPVRLVWHIVIYSETKPDISAAVLIDAHSGAEVLYYHFCAHIKNRILVDLEDRDFFPEGLDRTENQAATGIADLDLVYDVLGQSHDFFSFNHGWENWHGGQVPDRTDQFAFVRLPVANAFYRPWVDTNAVYDSLGGVPTGATFFGTGFAADDVVAHEYTHGVTQFTSDLIYQGFSGAINESFSDVWGEFVDLTNDIGNDSDDVRWRIGEDISDALLELIEPGTSDLSFRNMADPTEFGDPDRLTSPLLISPNSSFDNGGVHINSGIGNKLCYLLTDGDDFNGQSIEGIGIYKTADLFWEAQTTIPMSGDYYDLYFALSQGAVNLDFSDKERINVLNAMRAVEIVPAAIDAIRLRAMPTRTVSGRPGISVDWPEFDTDGLVSVQLIRALNGFAIDDTEGVVVFTGPETEYLDQNVFDGVIYYYTLIIDLGDSGIIQAFATAVAGGEPAPILTEAFDTENPLDLATTQLLFAPVGPPNTETPGISRQRGYEGYELTVERNITALPVARNDADGQGITLPFVEDEFLVFPAGNLPIRFFGEDYPNFYVYEQGYLSFQAVDTTSTDHVPTLDAHFRVPRISFLFNNLSPSTGGEVWYRYLDDRFVLTFDRVPEWTPFTTVPLGTNTAQLEIFFSGHIRITYLELSSSQAIVGLSDGHGYPVSPRDLFEEATSDIRLTDLSQGALAPTQLRFEPLPYIVATPGDTIEFDVRTVVPAGASGTPQLSAAWNRDGAAPFADNGDGTGTFRWETGELDTGIVFVRYVAFLGNQRAFVDQRIFFDAIESEPVAINLTLAAEDGLGDATQDHTVKPGQALYADYDYSHPGLSRPLPGNPLTAKQGGFGEGYSEIRWYRNNLLQAGYFGSFTIPAGIIRPSERWKFSVLPVTQGGLIGV